VRAPARGQRLNGLACTSWTHCMAVGYPRVADEWNGTSWHAMRLPVRCRKTGRHCMPSPANMRGGRLQPIRQGHRIRVARAVLAGHGGTVPGRSD